MCGREWARRGSSGKEDRQEAVEAVEIVSKRPMIDYRGSRTLQ